MKILTERVFSKASKVNRLLFITALLFFITSCSPKGTNVVSSWSSEKAQNKTYKKVLVLGVSEHNSNRAEVESAVVKRLSKKNVSAVASLSLFPPQLQDAPVPEERMVSAIKSNNIDAVLVISLLDSKETEKVVPARSYSSPMYPHHGVPYYGYYSSMHRTTHTPGYTIKTQKFYLESNFYSVKSKELVWTAQSESIDPKNIYEFAVQYSKTIVNSMSRAKLFDPSK